MYAVIESGGKQFRVAEGDALKLEKLAAEPGESVIVEKVLAVNKDDRLQLGRPYVDGAKVTLKVVRHGKGKKIIVFKYKPKKNYRRKQGHRQPFTEVLVEKIDV